MTDAEVVARVLDGDAGAFSALVERHHAACLRYASHQLGDRHVAEDVVQESFVRAYRGLARYEERQTFRAWLFRILVNRCRSAAAVRKREHARFAPVLSDATASPDEASRFELGEHLTSALAELDPLQREAFLLKFGEDLEYGEIARLTGASISALKMRVKRAREHLRARWKDGEHDGPR